MRLSTIIENNDHIVTVDTETMQAVFPRPVSEAWVVHELRGVDPESVTVGDQQLREGLQGSQYPPDGRGHDAAHTGAVRTVHLRVQLNVKLYKRQAVSDVLPGTNERLIVSSLFFKFWFNLNIFHKLTE